jgi:long-chain acyl-CoA synthetase
MINIDFDIVGRWAERRRIAYTTYTDLAAKKEIYDLIEGEVRKVNESLPRAAAIAKFVLLYKELDADDDELTRTKKVRRSFVAERYNEIYEALYGVVSEVAITATIKYQDGRETTLSTVLEIRKMEAQA